MSKISIHGGIEQPLWGIISQRMSFGFGSRRWGPPSTRIARRGPRRLSCRGVSGGWRREAVPSIAERRGVIFVTFTLESFLRGLEAGDTRSNFLARTREAVFFFAHYPSCRCSCPVAHWRR